MSLITLYNWRHNLIKAMDCQPNKTEELMQKLDELEARIAELKKKLADTDYRAIKFAEGELTEEEYAPYREERRAWREEINALGG